MILSFTNDTDTVEFLRLSGSCPFTVIRNGREVFKADNEPDAEREYHAIVGKIQRKALEAKYGFVFAW